MFGSSVSWVPEFHNDRPGSKHSSKSSHGLYTNGVNLTRFEPDGVDPMDEQLYATALEVFAKNLQTYFQCPVNAKVCTAREEDAKNLRSNPKATKNTTSRSSAPSHGRTTSILSAKFTKAMQLPFTKGTQVKKERSKARSREKETRHELNRDGKEQHLLSGQDHRLLLSHTSPELWSCR